MLLQSVWVVLCALLLLCNVYGLCRVAGGLVLGGPVFHGFSFIHISLNIMTLQRLFKVAL